MTRPTRRTRPARLAQRAGTALLGLALTLTSTAAAAEEPSENLINPFACRGEALALMAGLSTDAIRAERDKRIDEPAPAGEASQATAHRYCVIATLMSRVGDVRAPEYFEKAIEANPAEGGYELWYGHYLGSVRGPRYPLLESAELHYYRALDKLRRRRDAGAAQEFDANTEEWVQRKLLELYQEDGLPLLPWKAFPYARDGANAPGLFFTGQGRVAMDTNDFVDVSDVRKFTSEAMFAESDGRLARALTVDERRGIIRAPLRYELTGRVRLRQRILGALDFSYRALWLKNAQIIRFIEPNTFGDARVDEIGATYRRPIDLYPVADVMLEGSYKRVNRVGIVEWLPDQKEPIDMIEAKPAISRFLGPDKLTLGMNFVYMSIPELTSGPLNERARSRTIKAFYFEYAIYRPLLLPQLHHGTMSVRRVDTRGWHFYGGAALDDEQFGTKTVKRQDFYFGTSLRGMGDYDVTLQGTVFRGGVREAGADIAQLGNAQYRTTLILLKRIIDADVTPGIPEGVRPAFMNLVVPIKHDLAIQGMKDYENVRAGVELWARGIATGLRGPSFLMSAGYHFEYFYRLEKGVHIVRADLGMGF